MSAADTEFELKFQVPPERSAAVEAALKRGRAQRTRLRARYFDSAGEALARAGLTLRLRQEGRAWVQTAKGPGHGDFERLEHNVPVEADGEAEPDLQLHEGQPVGELLRAALHGERLLPCFETDVTRLSRVIEAGGTAVEVALDRGRIRANSRSQAVSELEFELKQGSPAALVELAQRWSEEHGLWLDPLPKSGVGRRLAQGIVEPPPVRAQARKLSVDSANGLLASALGAGLQQVLGNAREIAAGVFAPEHVHQLRVGLRRVRTVLLELDELPALAGLDPQVEPVLHGLFRILGRHRDLTTLLPDLEQEVMAAGGPIQPWQPALPDLPDLPAAVRAAAVQSALLQLLAFLQELEQAPHGGSLKETRKLARARLARLHRQSLRKGRRFARLTQEERHEERKRVKRLRYLAELVRPLFPRRAVDRFVAALEGLQDALGSYQDLAAGRALFEERSRADPAAWFGAGWLAARGEQCARECEKACRKAAAKAQPFWE